MIIEENKRKYYQALLDKNSKYEGIFYVGVKTTGVFCRPSCVARKPKFDNCEFFLNIQQALQASYRPCKRCKPFLQPNQASDLIVTLVEAVEKNPEKRWRSQDLRNLSVDSSTARRQFKKRFNMTFIEYARASRMGLAIKQIRNGEAVIETQLDAGYESSSGFRDAFTRIMGAAPTKFQEHLNILKASWLDTPLGTMIAIADESKLYLLEFIDRRGLEREIESLRFKTKSAILPGMTLPIESIKEELKLYFAGKLKNFKTPLHIFGSPFQKLTWEALIDIPYGQTISYATLAKSVAKPTAFRAVANANGLNQICIVIPCHRVINANGKLGGYSGGLERKKWLLNHERHYAL